MRVVGLMSGTSYDAIEAAVAEISIIDQEVTLRPMGAFSVPYPEEVRRAIGAALPPAATTVAEVCRLDTLIGQVFADTAARAVAEGGPADLVVSHGQTVYHWVEDGRVRGTLQLGQPAWISERTGLPVIADLRPADVAAGGQGAPLVSLFDVLLLAGRPRVPAALNLGGIANITVVPAGRDPLAYDIGPANALIDAAVRHFTGRSLDDGGVMAAAGTVDLGLLDRLLNDPYYRTEPPKTTGKEHFHLPYLLERLNGSESPADVVATVTRLTARLIGKAAASHEVTELIVSGGGTRNPVLMQWLREEGPEVLSIDELGIPSAAKEAYAFALLGYLSHRGIPGTVPSCTGAAHPRVLGRLTPRICDDQADVIRRLHISA